MINGKEANPMGAGKCMQKGKAFILYTNTKKIARKGRLVTESRKKRRYSTQCGKFKAEFLEIKWDVLSTTLQLILQTN